MKIMSQANRSVGRPGNIFADVSMHDIQMVISNWPLLEELDVWGWVGTRRVCSKFLSKSRIINIPFTAAPVKKHAGFSFLKSEMGY